MTPTGSTWTWFRRARRLILEKTDGFTPQDVDEHLCVLLLMLPSASRANKEALRMFKDAGRSKRSSRRKRTRTATPRF